MFGRKKSVPPFTGMDDSLSVADDFQLRITTPGFESYRPVNYRLYPRLTPENMLPCLDSYLDQLLAGEVDDANGDILDNLVLGAAREAVPELRRQQVTHQDMMRRLIVRHKADEADLRRIRMDRQQELEDLENNRANILSLLAGDTKRRKTNETEKN